MKKLTQCAVVFRFDTSSIDIFFRVFLKYGCTFFAKGSSYINNTFRILIMYGRLSDLFVLVWNGLNSFYSFFCKEIIISDEYKNNATIKMNGAALGQYLGYLLINNGGLPC